MRGRRGRGRACLDAATDEGASEESPGAARCSRVRCRAFAVAVAVTTVKSLTPAHSPALCPQARAPRLPRRLQHHAPISPRLDCARLAPDTQGHSLTHPTRRALSNAAATGPDFAPQSAVPSSPRPSSADHKHVGQEGAPAHSVAPVTRDPALTDRPNRARRPSPSW